MALQDTDLLLVQRGTQSYKLTGANAKSFLGGDLQAVTDRGNTTTNGATFGGNVDSDGIVISRTGDNDFGYLRSDSIVWEGTAPSEFSIVNTTRGAIAYLDF